MNESFYYFSCIHVRYTWTWLGGWSQGTLKSFIIHMHCGVSVKLVSMLMSAVCKRKTYSNFYLSRLLSAEVWISGQIDCLSPLHDIVDDAKTLLKIVCLSRRLNLRQLSPSTRKTRTTFLLLAWRTLFSRRNVCHWDFSNTENKNFPRGSSTERLD